MMIREKSCKKREKIKETTWEGENGLDEYGEKARENKLDGL